MRQLLTLPDLPNGTPQSGIASILPLSSLIEFSNVEAKLHCYELSGFGIMWNWPITPAGARLILGRCRDQEDRRLMGCLLDDGGERSTPLQCIDMCYGNPYPCTSSFTVRECARIAPLLKTLQFDWEDPHRLQRLEIIHVYRDGPEPEPGELPAPTLSLKWFAIVSIGWIVWAGAVVITVICAMPLALAYLLVLPATGLCVRHAFGHRPRPLSIERFGKDGKCWRRSVVVTNNFNEVEWSIYIGDKRLVNALLNKPILRHKRNTPNPFRGHNLSKILLYILISGQWGLVLAVSVLQSWDAIFVSAALIVGACTSTFLFRAPDSMSIWLKSNRLGLEKMSVTFSGRRAMLSAMVAISPDCQFGDGISTRWINPILESSPDRDQWERLLKKRILRLADDEKELPWLVSSVDEGLGKASEINKWLLERERLHDVLPSPQRTPFIINPHQ